MIIAIIINAIADLSPSPRKAARAINFGDFQILIHLQTIYFFITSLNIFGEEASLSIFTKEALLKIFR